MSTPTGIEDRLANLLDELADSTPITQSHVEFEPLRLTQRPTRYESDRRPVRTLAAAAAVVVLLGGLYVVSNRPEPLSTGTPVTTDGTEPARRHDTPSVPAQLDAAPVPADRLLYPTAIAAGGAPALTIAELDQGPRAMVQAPDGTLYRVAASKQGGYAPDPAADAHDIGDHRVVADTDGYSIGYSWTDGCVVTSVLTEADGATWAPEHVALLDSFAVAGGAVDLDLPPGWHVIDQGSNAPLVQLAYAVELDGVEHALVLGQSLDASIAALGSPMGPMEPVTLADGTPAWFEPDSVPSPRLTFAREGVVVWIWGEGLTADDMIAAAAQLAPAPAIWENLLTDGVEVEPTGTAPPGGQPDLCGPPTLSIGQ